MSADRIREARMIASAFDALIEDLEAVQRRVGQLERELAELAEVAALARAARFRSDDELTISEAKVEQLERELAEARHRAEGWVQHDTEAYRAAVLRESRRADRLAAALRQIADDKRPNHKSPKAVARAALEDEGAADGR